MNENNNSVKKILVKSKNRNVRRRRRLRNKRKKEKEKEKDTIKEEALISPTMSLEEIIYNLSLFRKIKSEIDKSYS